MARRTLAVDSAAVLAMVALAACGGSDEAGGSNTVTMWTYPVIVDQAAHQAFWDEQISAFNEEHPAIEVEVEIYPWANRDEALTTAIASNTAPDAVYLIPDQLPGYADAIEPVDGHLSEEALADYLPNVKESVTVDGEMLGAPILSSANPLVCDKSAFEAIGETNYPSTWDDLMELAPKFNDAGIDVTSYVGDTEQTLNMTFYPLLWQAGGSIFTEDDSGVAFDDEPGLEALTFLTDLAEGGYLEKDLLTTNVTLEQTRIAAGKVACTWQNVPVDLEAFWDKENIVVQPPLKNVEQVGYGTVGSLSMLNSAGDAGATAQWIEFATRPEAIEEYVRAAKMFSPKESTGELYADDPVYGPMEQTVQDMTVGSLHPKAREVMGVLAPEIQAALIGDKSPEQALDDAASAAGPVLR